MTVVFHPSAEEIHGTENSHPVGMSRLRSLQDKWQGFCVHFLIVEIGSLAIRSIHSIRAPKKRRKKGEENNGVPCITDTVSAVRDVSCCRTKYVKRRL